MKAYTYDEITIGQTEIFSKTMTKAMEDAFRAITGDENPLHRNDIYAREISRNRFSSHIVFGMLTASLFSTLAGMYLPGKYSLIHSLDKIEFRKPVFVGDVLTVSGVVREKQDDLKLIVVDAVIRNQDDKVVSKSTIKILLQK